MREARVPQDLLSGLNGPLEPIRARLSFGTEQRLVVPSTQLLRGDALSTLMQRYARRFEVEPDRYLVSIWSQKYLATVIIPIMALAMLGGRALDAAIESTAVVLDEGGEPVALRVPCSFASDGKDTAASLLVSMHLAPFAETLSGWSGLSRKVLWGNAAHYLEWIIRQFPGGETPIALPAPMTDSIRYVDEDGARVRRRKVCCLRDRVPGVEDCGSLCPERKTRTKT
ncbi:siderophore-iron reductase FhuF [Rhizobium sp. WL3]|uniref:siderophore-iron reductase FhuF n=1 Tax=Rhizobium sp. WL3 TaxID=2603277 RepID=UPI0011C1F27A|nr:siderophore-iron reductase FhuF [Rhizobium sp. WL3]QEE46591.1 siderophore-iron reductase FhuF [Rhizobium sp. WL3]